MTKEPIPFPLTAEKILDIENFLGSIRLRAPKEGIFIGPDVDNDIVIINFGYISRKDALWLSELLRRHAFGEAI